MENTEEFRSISLCTGYAGIELGLKRVIANLRTVAYVEIEAFACANLVAKIEENKLDVAPIWTDIKDFPAAEFRDRVHLITGGYPCQGESVAGKRLGTADPRWLWPYIERIIKAVRPVWCFFENVRGHLTGGFPEVYRSLRLMGYKVEAGLFTAAEVGAPHKRERLFILAYNNYGQSDTAIITEPVRQTQFESCDDSRKRRKQLDNSTVGRHGEKKEICTRRDGIVGTSELANSINSMRQSTEQRKGGKPERAGESLANSEYPKPRPGEQGVESEAPKNRRDRFTVNRWPSRPGQEQYDWEEPRTVKSGMGRTVDGASPKLDATANRVDRLRLLGNGVVPDCAELAFRTLYKEMTNG